MARPDEENAAATAKRPWYASGLAFECRPDCGRCCTNHGDYAYVYLQEGDVDRLAEHLGLEVDEFLTRHTLREDGHVALRMQGPACTFLDGSRCGVYAARPTQCKTFPFWEENLRSRRAWDGLRSFCPGIGEGPVQDLVQIRRQVTARGDD